MQVELVLDVERLLTKSLRRRWTLLTEEIRPRRRFDFNFFKAGDVVSRNNIIKDASQLNFDQQSQRAQTIHLYEMMEALNEKVNKLTEYLEEMKEGKPVDHDF